MSKTIAIANQKGGVGKTTTAVNLSTSLALLGKKVLLLDMDPQGNATTGIGIDKNDTTLNSIYDVLIEDLDINESLYKTQVQDLFICPSSIDLAGAEVELVSAISRENKLKNAFVSLDGKYDFHIIDCPPSLGLLTVNALTAADSILVPIQCEFYALEGLTQLMNTIKIVQKHLNRDLEIEGVVLTMYDSRVNLSLQVVEEVKKYFKNKVYGAIIPRNVRLSEAPSYGLPIFMYDDKSKGAEAYMELAREVIEYQRSE